MVMLLCHEMREWHLFLWFSPLLVWICLILSSHFRLVDSADALTSSEILIFLQVKLLGRGKFALCVKSKTVQEENLSQLRSSLDSWTIQELPGVDHTIKWWLSLQPWLVSGKAVHKRNMGQFFGKRVGTIGQKNKYMLATLLFYIFNVTKTSRIRKM